MKIGINGGGVGGLAAAIALRQAGHDVKVDQQATNYNRVGADINLTPNAVRALDSLSVGPALRETVVRPTHRISRTWDSGEETSRLEMAEAAEQKYGAPQLTIHCADLLNALRGQLPDDVVLLGHRIEAIDTSGAKPSVTFANGTTRTVDALVGADGIHSPTRAALFGAEYPEFTGLCHTARWSTVTKLDLPNLDAFTKWWGPCSIPNTVTFPL